MREEKIVKLVEELRELNNRVPVLVEGIRDIRALRTLGFQGTILKINEGLSLREIAEKIALNYSSIIILTDWDRKGNILEKAILTYLQYYNIRVDTQFKRKFAYYSKKEIRTVEDMDGYIAQCEEKIKEK